MRIRIGHVSALFRYPVKSMAGERLETADLGWHGLDGDRRLGLRRRDDRQGFPWLTASKLPDLVRYVPVRAEGADASALPAHVRTPDGDLFDTFGDALAAEMTRRHGAPIEVVHLNRGIFDEASVSLITAATVDEAARLASLPADVRRFRPNVLIALERAAPFEEDGWVGGRLAFGESEDAALVVVTNYDERCVMVNIDPDTARQTPELLKAIVRARNNRAGVYGTAARRGRLSVGQAIYFEPMASA